MFRVRRRRGFFSRKELNDLLISWLTLSFAFTWFGLNVFTPKGVVLFVDRFVLMLVAVGSGFIFHELAHKVVAERFGAFAEFRAWLNGLALALGLAFLTSGGMVFAAPGAVYVDGHGITRKQNGLISLAGPVTNVIVGVIFAVMAIGGILKGITMTAAYVNFFLGAFNMIPVFPLDGSKVFVWNPLIWSSIFIPLVGIVFAISGGMVF